MPNKKIDEQLEASHYRLTQQRKAVLDVMRENIGCHLTAEEVLVKARHKVPNIGIATVYRTLERLVSMQILYKTLFDGGKYRYEISIQEDHQHHHIICVSCNKIFEVEESLLNSLEHYLEQQGFEIVDHQLKIYAYCPQCKAEKV
ncbi:MAG: transcriptional repressor [Syntrophomonadaceae bacterium]|nr:transcriptional repressor [Syntrophomonadaceae bacterium]